MSHQTFLEHYDRTNQYSDYEYLIYKLLYHSAVTFVGEKTSTLINFINGARPLKDIWDTYRNQITSQVEGKYEIFELSRSERNVVLLLYRPERLALDLKETENAEFLNRFGYTEEMGYREALERLKMRFSHSCPHEVGIFLGYPIHDVRIYADCPHKDCLLVGYWKVYDHVEKAKATFKRYDRIREQLLSRLIHGVLPSELMAS